ncbi:alpha/beta hydrolase [Cerasicoccus frondis]|uniref:alpha/beta hydrolase n=1 Tax=Cerasicoccus frondis TaxID=490090 RepID=UPI00285269AB|nr:alpha/beta hydrolase-fold protein [Cerasicoccus frondis]
MNLSEHTLASRCGAYERQVWILSGPVEPHRMCIFLDAEHYTRDLKALPVLEELLATGVLPPMTLVFVSHVSAAARHADYACNLDYAAFIAEDVFDWARERCPGIQVTGNIIAGLSLSALQSAYIVLRYTSRFDYCLAQSGAFWWNDSAFMREAKEHSAAGQRFWLSVGNRETQSGLTHQPSGMRQDLSQLDSVRAAVDVLRSIGSEVHYHEYEGGHAAKPWREELPAAFAWLLGS